VANRTRWSVPPACVSLGLTPVIGIDLAEARCRLSCLSSNALPVQAHDTLSRASVQVRKQDISHAPIRYCNAKPLGYILASPPASRRPQSSEIIPLYTPRCLRGVTWLPSCGIGTGQRSHVDQDGPRARCRSAGAIWTSRL